MLPTLATARESGCGRVRGVKAVRGSAKVTRRPVPSFLISLSSLGRDTLSLGHVS